jgi:CubicO group peptidase (beta-lactamase class C family)
LDVTVELADLTAMVDSIDRAHGLPAMGGAIVTSRGLIGIGVAGDRRIGGPPATVEDCWHIGSNMKAVTAFMAAVAVNDGILDWSRTVPEAFPETEVREEYRDVTLRDLVTNQSGLPAHFSGPLQAQDARGQRDEVAAWAFVQVPAAERGNYSYSNIGFAMAGAMLERAYGEAFEPLIQSRLFDPLGLDEVGWGPQTEPGASDNPVPHSWGGNGWEPCEGCDNPPWVGPAGRMHLPLGEWARIIQELLRAKEGDSDLISRSAGQLLSTGVVPINDNWDYGYGWIVRPWDWVGDDVLWHGGCNGYNYSQALVAPTPDFAILTVTNAGDLSERRDRFPVNELVDRMLLYYASGQ